VRVADPKAHRVAGDDGEGPPLYGKTSTAVTARAHAPDDKDWLRDKITKNQKVEIDATEAFAAVVAPYWPRPSRSTR
jgi:hypothetical protein